jgi:xanthine dehydrogenase small subunit
MLRFVLNQHRVAVERPPGLAALDYLRRDAGLTGVKHACREGDCGSCAVLLGRPSQAGVRYRVVTSCLLPLGAVDGCHLVTVEGLNDADLTPLQKAFVDRGASQCGFCTPGFVVALTGHMIEAESWRPHDMVEAVAGNICRCTGYTSIVRAIHDLAERLEATVDPDEPRIPALVREGLLPPYFAAVTDLLEDVEPVPAASRPPPEALVVAGGTDLYVQRPEAVENSRVFLVGEPAAPPIWRDGSHVYLAGAATAEDIKRSRLLDESVGGLDRAMELMGSLPIRNRATIAGNLVNASPIGDMTIVLLALDAEMALVQNNRSRTLPLRDFFLAYKTLDLRPGELVAWARFSPDPTSTRFNFEKVSKRTHLDIASVNSAISLHMDGDRIAAARVSAGGVSPIPCRLARTEAFLSGRSPNAETAHGAAAVARGEVAPISDVRGTAEYKRLLLGQLVLAHFNVLFGIESGLMAEVTA